MGWEEKWYNREGKTRTLSGKDTKLEKMGKRKEMQSGDEGDSERERKEGASENWG